MFRIEGPGVGGSNVDSVETRLFTVQGKLAGPKVSADKPGKHYSSPVDVRLTATDAANESSTIWYTLDGSDPTTDGSNPASHAYSSSIRIENGNTTLKFIGRNQSGGFSAIVTEHYIVGSVPSASPQGGFFNQTQTVTLTRSDSDLLTVIHYTIDGSEPAASSPVYNGPLTINSTTTVKFREHYADGTSSSIVTEVYTIDRVKPAVIADDPIPGFYHTVQNVTFRATEQAILYYTTNGETPSDSSTRYDGKPIKVDRTTTFKLLAVDRGGNQSDVLTAAFNINIGQSAVGPLSTATGFPSWYRDSNGLELQLCVDAVACLTSVPDLSLPASVPGNFPDEAFWWNATAQMDVGRPDVQNKRGRASLVLATEAAFASGDVKAGQQIAFNRIRVRISGLEPNATYVVTHPYGKESFTSDENGAISSTEDIGCLDPGGSCLAGTVLDGRLGPWLTWDAGAPDGYVGDGATEHLVKGSPTGANFFLIEGPNAGGNGIDRAETLLFVVAGKLSTTP